MLTHPATTVKVDIVDQVPDLDYRWETDHAPGASPLAGPTWLAANITTDTAALGRVRYLVVRDNGGAAVLPMHIVDQSAGPDADPRTYFGWQPESGQACCGSTQASEAAAELDAIHPDRLFPTLLLGSLPGYQTEILHSFWSDELATILVDAALDYARAERIPTMLAPWIADRGAGPALAAALRDRGAAEAFWALEDHLPLPHPSWDAHVAALRYRDRYRINQDLHAATDHGITIHEIPPDELPEHLPRIGQLVAANKRRHHLPAHDDELPTTIAAITARGIDVVATAGFQHDQLVACCLSIAKNGRLYAKYAGIDYHTLGTRSSVYFAVVVHATAQAAYRHGHTSVEYGVGAHQAKILRGCHSRTISSHLINAHPDITNAFRRAAPAASQQRRDEYPGPHTPPQPAGESCRC